MKQEQVEAWFGDRGLPLSATKMLVEKLAGNSSPRQYRVIDNKWIFISNKYQLWFDANDDLYRVEMYCLSSDCAEVYDDWEEEGFDWSYNNCRLLTPEENQ